MRSVYCTVTFIIPYFLEISPRQQLISWSSFHFEGSEATKLLVTLRMRIVESGN